MKGMQEPTMLYRKGTEQRLHGVRVDTKIVDAKDVDDHLDDGWFRTPTEVNEAEGESDSQEAAIKRAREEGARAVREAEQQRLFDEALQKAREEGAREERERIAAQSAPAADKAPASKKAQ